MELSSKSIRDVIHPTAAFSKSPPRVPPPVLVEADSWGSSQLNPKNRIDSLGPLADPLWRIDGCTGLGTQYYVLPLFLGATPPMRFDVFIPEEAANSPLLRQLLDLEATFHTKDPARVRRLGIASHILRTLQAWTATRRYEGPDSVSSMYKNLPFGSRIIFENLDLNIHNIKVTIAPTYYVEKQLIGLARLASSLGLAPDLLPEAIDISRLSIVKQLHDSVCLVHIDHANQGRDDKGGDNENDRELWILKALTSGPKYLYIELRNLLRMEPHAHVISRPRYLVTKYCRFGGKTAVVGFVLRFHTGGSLRDTLPLLRIHDQLALDVQLKWTTQLASAVLHVRERGGMFYPDLRLDNIVLSGLGDVVMVDFEQRGVWCEFAAPEVNALDYARILASSDENNTDDDPAVPEDVRSRFAAVLTRQLPGWESLQDDEEYTARGHASYNVPWLCLSAAEQEAAEVYMLGRVLWCVFEGQSAPQLAAVWQSYQREPEMEFPEFRHTPPHLRDLVNRCTRGRRDGLSRLITRRGSKLVLRSAPAGRQQQETDQDGDAVAAFEVHRVAQEWWRTEVKAAEDFLLMRERMKARGEWDDNYFKRPTLEQVLDELKQFQATSVGFAPS
ncbi:hypothetical protein B0T26DRAFT_633562 [Lasiosphaeria miniovina]|uniref:Protein kinase domain-containing protein n=1 Tax=Lasiosphaeria miniovina TaxID=1954250 RepID=A0AA40BI45_9PEZI|nr:uncharacterized protein B0T26DRAFT_633562 [Lasiosphaeria miniovina]KAK0734453.1 hypothetical protein B0T26DRAFT_633562 [Lasiosphaeria miniovina]